MRVCVPASGDGGSWVAGKWVWLCELVVIPFAAFFVFRPCISVRVCFGRKWLQQLWLGCWLLGASGYTPDLGGRRCIFLKSTGANTGCLASP